MIEQWVNQIHRGDALDVLRQMPESSVHMAMCSPPYYGLRDYGVEGQIGLEETLEEYIESLVDVGAELRRVLRDDGSWWLNLGDTFSGGWGVMGKPDRDDLHNDDAYPDDPPARDTPLGRKNKMLVPHRVAIALQEAGWVVRADCVWAKPNPMPHPVKDRLTETKEYVFHLTPAPDYWFDLESVREPHKERSIERATRSDYRSTIQAHGGDIYSDRKNGSHPHNFDTPLHPNGKNPGDVFSVVVRPFPDAHFAVYPPELCETPIKTSCPEKVCAECSKPYDRDTEVVEREVAGGVSRVPTDERGYADRQGKSQNDREGLTQPTERRVGQWEPACDCEGGETIPGVVLDPFAGAGTTCLVAKRLGRRFIGIELNPKYVAMAQRRVGIDVDEPERLLEDGQATLADGGTLDAEPGGGQ